MRYTTTPSWYLEPRAATIRRYARREGMPALDQTDMDFVLDLCSASVGAEVREFDRRSHKAMAERLAPSRKNYRPHYHDDAVDQVIDWLESRHEVLERFNLNTAPGRSTVVRAVRVLKLVKLLEKVDEDSLLFLLILHLNMVSSLDAMALELFLLLAGGDEFTETGAGQQLALEFAASKVDVPEMLRICRQVDELTDFSASRKQPRIDPEGDDSQLRRMNNISELTRVNARYFGLPTELLLLKASRREFLVRETITHRANKQLFYFMVDSSASMCQADRIGRALGVVLSKLELVLKGEAEVFLRLFDTQLGMKEYHANSAESARALMRELANYGLYGGGGTNFWTALQAGGRRMGELVSTGNLREPELVMITDGEGDTPDLSVLGGARLHVVQVGDTYSASLANLARSSGGLAIDARPKKLQKGR